MSLPPELAALTVRNYPQDWSDLDTRAIDTARVLAADAVEKVGSGHPGTAMSLAPLAYTLYQRVLRHDPQDPAWIGRDRFILSAGHSSLTQYIQLYLGGFGLELDDLRALRTWGSLTPGHPEYGHTQGVEMTTGPLGQGLASSVGMAMAQRRQRLLLDPDSPAGESPFDHYTYVIASDGDIQEGVTAEASSLAGTQQLGNLIVFWDDNGISIEDDTNIAFTEDVSARYAAYGWQTLEVTGEDVEGILDAVEEAKKDTQRPTFIRMRTVIGYPAPTKQNTGGVHGAALGAEEIIGIKEILGFPTDQSFLVDDEVIAHTRQLQDRAKQARDRWQIGFDRWAANNPEQKTLLDRLLVGELPENYNASLPTWQVGDSIATRKASEATIQALAAVMPEFWGGSADLAGSNNTLIKGADSFGPTEITTSTFTTNPGGRNLHFGIREHAMGSILNGIALHGGSRPYGGTFLVFSDYMRPPVRLAALMGVDTYYVWTHDSIGLGEDGPTHQPVEHLASLRAIPGLSVLRPADANETAASWAAALAAPRGPKALVLTRQNVPVLEGTTAPNLQDKVSRGAYILRESSTDQPQVILMGSGSELQLAVAAAEELESQGIGTRVLSVPCLDWFLAQEKSYIQDLLPPDVQARVSVEAGIAMPWYQLTGTHGRNVSLEHYGASADYQRLFQEFGITTEAVIAAAQDSLSSLNSES